MAMHSEEMLSDERLVSVLLRGRLGVKRAQSAAAEVMLKLGGDLLGLSMMSVEEVCRETGLSAGAAESLWAGVELGRRLRLNRPRELPKATSPSAVASYLRGAVESTSQEELHVFLLDSRLGIRRDVRITVGLVDRSLVHAREVYREAIRSACSSILLAHNHPSGDVTPSGEDIRMTTSLEEAGEIIGVRLLDHVVVTGARDDGGADYYSFRENRLLKSSKTRTAEASS